VRKDILMKEKKDGYCYLSEEIPLAVHKDVATVDLKSVKKILIKGGKVIERTVQ